MNSLGFTGKNPEASQLIIFFPLPSLSVLNQNKFSASSSCVWTWSLWLMASKSMVCQRCLWGICSPNSGTCLGHADVKYTGFLEKDDISASSATSGHPRRESACCLPLELRYCWLRNQKRSFEVISELHLQDCHARESRESRESKESNGQF